jgi:VWFA-related protein
MQMRKLTEETGGRVINVGNNGKKLEDAFAQIEEELRTQYLASYTPTDNKLDGSYRKLDISCKGDGLKVQARKGYYAVGDVE